MTETNNIYVMLQGKKVHVYCFYRGKHWDCNC